MSFVPASGKVDVPIEITRLDPNKDIYIYKQGKLCILYISNVNLNLTTTWEDNQWAIPSGFRSTTLGIYVDGVSSTNVGYMVYTSAGILQCKRNSSGSGTVKVNCVIPYFTS